MDRITLTPKQELLLNQIADIVKENCQGVEYYAQCGVLIKFEIEEGTL